MRPFLSTASSFAAPTVDKVERLLEVLAALRDDPLLGSAFVLHGGTALNVFSDELPRLSIDVDFMYVGQVEVSAMQTERPRIDARLREVTGKLGYAVRGTNDEHSGQTYRLRYGDQYIKIDVSYLARVALLAPVEQTCPICTPPVSFPVLDRRELVAGKVKALVERIASRDLYDLARMAARPGPTCSNGR
jgi:predicted nucleotidyltransferase component of viral defense system